MNQDMINTNTPEVYRKEKIIEKNEGEYVDYEEGKGLTIPVQMPLP